MAARRTPRAAMILAAGRGLRMRPLTDTVPKPLLRVRGQPLIERHVEHLARVGVERIIINLAWLGSLIRDHLGDGSRYGTSILYSDEAPTALETAGGIFRALPLLGPDPFVVVNGDVLTDYPLERLILRDGRDAHVVLVPNPPHHPQGDFGLEHGVALANADRQYTFAGIAAYRPAFFAGCSDGSFPLKPLLVRSMAAQRCSAELYAGVWEDVGTPERLAALNGVQSGMAEFKGIPIAEEPRPVRSGEKYTTSQGFTAIKDGMKPSGTGQVAPKKPSWLRAPLAGGAEFAAVRRIVREHRLSTVCEEAKCPNIGECWNAGTATIMLMGAVCTRACRFCAVDTGNPRGWLDPEEPENVARSVELMGLKYVVLTSVNRDDLPDGGAAHYAAAIRAIKQRCPATAVEALTPDFAGVMRDVGIVVDSGLDVFAQNVETVQRLTHPVRDARAGYGQTLEVLRFAKTHRPAVLTKTSLMLGLGETDAEIRRTMEDLRAVAVDILTLGQYLRPTPNHLQIERFVTPEEFDRYREWALSLGFLECVSGPLVRSSYRAEQALARNNAGLDNSRLVASRATGAG